MFDGIKLTLTQVVLVEMQVVVYSATTSRWKLHIFYSVSHKCNSAFNATRLINLLPNLNGLSVWLQNLANTGNGLPEFLIVQNYSEKRIEISTHTFE